MCHIKRGRWSVLVKSELLSFAGYVALFWMVGSRASKRLGLSESTQVTLGGWLLDNHAYLPHSARFTAE